MSKEKAIEALKLAAAKRVIRKVAEHLASKDGSNKTAEFSKRVAELLPKANIKKASVGTSAALHLASGYLGGKAAKPEVKEQPVLTRSQLRSLLNSIYIEGRDEQSSAFVNKHRKAINDILMDLMQTGKLDIA